MNGGSVEFEQYSMVEDLVDALADVECFTVLEPAEEVEAGRGLIVNLVPKVLPLLMSKANGCVARAYW